MTKPSSLPVAAKDLPAAAPAAGGSTASRVAPTSWDAIRPNDVVLAADFDRRGDPDGWYEAIVLTPTLAGFRLKWRDYPGVIERARDHVALLYPAPSA